MALTATVHRLRVEVSDVDRAVYETLDLRLARHPSETMRYLLTRALAYCLCYEEGITFSRGLSEPDEPALWVRDLRGDLLVWIEVGAPSGARLHKASKAVPRVVVFTWHDPDGLRREAEETPIHRVERVEVFALAPAFLDALAEVTERKTRWTLLANGGEVYVTVGERTIRGAVERHRLVADRALGDGA